MNTKQHVLFDRLRDEVTELEEALDTAEDSRRASIANEAVDVLYFLLEICSTERLSIDVLLAHASYKYEARAGGFVHKAGEREYATGLVSRSDEFLDGLTHEEYTAVMDIPKNVASLARHALFWRTRADA